MALSSPFHPRTPDTMDILSLEAEPTAQLRRIVDDPAPSRPRASAPDLTTVHVRQAIAGDLASHSWLVEHFSPALLVQAEYRLPASARRDCDPEDIVQEVWMIVLPKLPLLRARDGRMTPVLVKYLGTTLLHRVNKHLRGILRGDRLRRPVPADVATGEAGSSDPVWVEVTGVVTAVVRRERGARVRQCIAALGDRDREVVVLRGIEQHANAEVAAMLGEPAATVSRRYRRALARLREALPESVFAELPDDGS